MSVEENLLFGLLAWQNALISDEQFLFAMRSWSKNKRDSLATILQQQHALSEHQRELLGPMVEANIRLHDRDAARALRSMGSSVDILRQAREQIDDPGLCRSIDESTLLSMGHEGRNPASAERTRPWSTEKGQPGGRFRIVRPHARGGLGEVFVAQDGELNREVAVKEIQHRYSDHQESRERFLLEAEVTGSLEHPGIVPVYGLGHYADGRPYYAMRFIKGDSLKEAIEQYRKSSSDDATERSLQLRKLLGRFVDVCQSISYAHSRGVLHRDLKPGNIMLGKYGETLVVDWGLARIVGRSEQEPLSDEQTLKPASGSGVTPTMLGSAIGTPAYMPPEQARGDLGQIGPQSDVYSLGATLYHLLTGRPPFVGDDVNAVLQNVRKGHFPPPINIDQTVPKSLNAICLRAMSLNGSERYASPTDLADDIERYLADEAVTALPESIPIRAWRWVRKHQAIASTTAASVLLLTVGLAAFSTVVSSNNVALKGLNDTLEQRRQELDTALAELTEANQRESTARTAAEQSAAAAQKQSELALATLTGVINDVQHSLTNLPGGAAVRKRLLMTAMQRLSDVSTDFVLQASVDYPTMIALMQMGDLVLQVGTDDGLDAPSEAEHSDGNADAHRASVMGAAEKFYVRSHAMAMQLAQEFPSDSAVRESLVMTRTRIGDLHQISGDLKTAIMHYETARSECEMMLEQTQPLSTHREMLSCLNKLGGAHLQLGDLPRAHEYFAQSLETTERLLGDDPDNEYLIGDQIFIYSNLATIYSRQGDLDKAQELYSLSLEQTKKLQEQNSEDATAKSGLALAHRNVAWTRLEHGDISGAITEFKIVLDLFSELSAADPEQLLYQRMIADAHSGIGDAYLLTGDNTEAQPHLVAAHETIKRVASRDKRNVSDAIDLSGSYTRVGDNLLALGREDEADAAFNAQLQVFTELDADLQQNADLLRSRANAYERMGEMLLRKGQTDAAGDMFKMMLGIKQQLADADPTDMLAARELSITHRHLGDVLQQDQPEEALKEYAIALEQAIKIAEVEPKRAVVQRHLANAYYNVADTAAVLLKFDMAAENLRGAIDVQRHMSEVGIEDAEVVEQAVAELASYLSRVERAPSALAPWDELLSRPPTQVRELIELRGIIAARTGRYNDCVEIAHKMVEMKTSRDIYLYNAACMMSLAVELRQSELAKAKQSETEPTAPDVTADNIAQLQAWTEEGIGYLRRLVEETGYSDASYIQQDSDLAAIRGAEGFQAILDLARKNASSGPNR